MICNIYMRDSFILLSLIGVGSSPKIKVLMINGFLMVLFEDHRRVWFVIITMVFFLFLTLLFGPDSIYRVY